MKTKIGAIDFGKGKRALLKPHSHWRLTGEERRIWDQKLLEEKSKGQLDLLDGDVLAIYCQSVARYSGLLKKSHLTDEDRKSLKRWRKLIVMQAKKLQFDNALPADLSKSSKPKKASKGA